MADPERKHQAFSEENIAYLHFLKKCVEEDNCVCVGEGTGECWSLPTTDQTQAITLILVQASTFTH